MNKEQEEEEQEEQEEEDQLEITDAFENPSVNLNERVQLYYFDLET